MTENQASTGTAGDILMRNIKRIRDAQRVTFVELAERLDAVGRGIPVLGLRRIEQGKRRVDVDDLLALSVALGVHPVDLLVPGDADEDEPYGVTPKVATTTGTARDWIAGRGFLATPESLPDMAEGVRYMPKARAQQVMKAWWTPEREFEQNRRINRAAEEEE